MTETENAAAPSGAARPIAQILLADDDVQVAEMFADYLSAQGHRVIRVSDGFQLAQKAAEHRPHLIIADIQMPGAYGSSAYATLQKDSNTASIPIIFVSGHPREKVARLIPAGPNVRFLQKPVELPHLDAAIRELLPRGGYCP